MRRRRLILRRLLKLFGVGSLALLVTTLSGAFVLDRFLGRDVQLIVPKPAEVVELERELWEPGQPVAAIYGVPVGGTTRIVGPDPAKIVRPSEDRSLLLMRVDKQRGENPLQVKTVWFVTLRLILGLGIVSLVGLLGTRWLSRRHNPQAAST